ncbi:Hypothetical predicted protein [Mytilus galloprovincialis]|uniref:Uncharacterized protein n=1 Tax=Mytilus galloprovincialis TaxID=29158 RepID=A0A8B6BVH4_MYTGA|nr:Hypothetical predicted protein [Mytilus galloprovincialis]
MEMYCFYFKVRGDLHKDSQVDAMFLFDGKGSTNVSRFSKERLLQSTYKDLSRTSKINYFSMAGEGVNMKILKLIMDGKKLFGCIGMVYILLTYVTAATNSVPINLIDNNKVPLVAMLDTASLDKNMKTYINQVILQSLGDSVKETVQAIIKEEFEQLISNSSMPTSGTASNQTINSVFIACPGNKRSVYRSWLTPAPFDETLKISSKTCENDHKRRSIIDRWNRDAEDLIDQVRVDLYKDSQVDAMFLFDGKGSTSVSWFSKEKLLQSTYQDLSRTATTNYFSMDGYYSADRHFYINSHHGGCPNDFGWLLIIDPRLRSGSGGCTFDHLYGREYPYFMYGTGNKVCHYDKEGECGFADMMVVSVKRI